MSFQCPSCGKDGFQTHSAIARHMSQPRSRCNSWLDDLIRLKSHFPPRDTNSMECDDVQVGPSYEDVHEGYGENVDDGGWGSVTGDRPGATTQDINLEGEMPGITDCFPGAATTYGAGHTFLGLFNSDENSVYRKTNLYYPFSCRQDWEIASWLLRSGLSMGKIDSFLSLEMVSHNQYPLNQ